MFCCPFKSRDVAIDDNQLDHIAFLVADDPATDSRNSQPPSLWRMRYSNFLQTPVLRASRLLRVP
jgi:hypothetical protein